MQPLLYPDSLKVSSWENDGLNVCDLSVWIHMSHLGRIELISTMFVCSISYLLFVLWNLNSYSYPHVNILYFPTIHCASGATGEGNGSPLQYSCLENPVDRGAWWAAVHRVTQSQTWLKRLSMHACIGKGNGNSLQCSCLENPMGGGAWRAAVCGVTQSRTRLKRLSSSSSSDATRRTHMMFSLQLIS